jgi:enoyl-CoA hydratase
MASPIALAQTALDPAALAALAAYGDSAAGSPFAEPPWLLIRPEAGLSESEAQGVARWLRGRPCPVIAVEAAGSVDPILAEACDVRLEPGWSLETLLARIAAAPLAALVLVQVLRATESLPLEPALVIESLGFATLQNGPEFRAWLAGRVPPPDAAEERDPPLLAERQGAQLALTLNRPTQRNAVDRRLRDALAEALDEARLDQTVSSIALRGAGRCFSVGGDLAEFGGVSDPTTAHAIRMLRSPALGLARVAERLSVRVHGPSIGAGVEMAAFGRRVTAAPGAGFQLPELAMGLIPGAGGCVSLPRRIGRQRTALLALSGRRIGAATALAWGLVDEIEPAA